MMLDSLLQGFLFVKVKGDGDNFLIAAQSVKFEYFQILGQKVFLRLFLWDIIKEKHRRTDTPSMVYKM